MIHCDFYSRCNVSIKKSLFIDNFGGCYHGTHMINGILLEQYTYGKVFIKDLYLLILIMTSHIQPRILTRVTWCCDITMIHL